MAGAERDEAARRIDADRRAAQREFLAGAERSKLAGMWMLAVAVLGWAWIVWRLVTGQTGTGCGVDPYPRTECVTWAPWTELLVVLAVAGPLAVAGAALYTKGAVSVRLSHHALSMAGYLDRAAEATRKEPAAGKPVPGNGSAEGASPGTPRPRRGQ